MGAFVESEERLAALVESETNSASSHVRLTELLALEARRNVVAEARLQVVKDRARAEVTMAHAELAIAMQRLGSQDHELQIALGRLADFSNIYHVESMRPSWAWRPKSTPPLRGLGWFTP